MYIIQYRAVLPCLPSRVASVYFSYSFIRVIYSSVDSIRVICSGDGLFAKSAMLSTTCFDIVPLPAMKTLEVQCLKRCS